MSCSIFIVLKMEFNSKGGSLSRLCERVVEFILSRNTGDLVRLDNEQIARIFKVDPSFLCRQFETEQRISLNKFIARERMYRAFFMIEKDQILSGRELAQELGFPHPRIFYEEFKSLFLISPDKYISLKRRSQKPTGCCR